MASNHLILCRPLLLLPSIFPSIRVFSKESVLHIRWPKYSSFSFSINPSNEYSGLISFRSDWLKLLVVQETLKSLLQHHSSKASILLRYQFGSKNKTRISLTYKWEARVSEQTSLIRIETQFRARICALTPGQSPIGSLFVVRMKTWVLLLATERMVLPVWRSEG